MLFWRYVILCDMSKKDLLVLALLVFGCEASRAQSADAATDTDDDAPEIEEPRVSAPAPVDDEDQLSKYVAQCEAVLGPIPKISCDPAHPAPGTHVTRIPTFVNGYLLGFGGPLDSDLLNRRAQTEDYTCDFPSIGGDFPCSVGSTLVQYQDEDNPNVQWVGLCRGAPGDHPNYDRFIGNGLIGANTVTGEMCFFFGVNPDVTETYELPALSGGEGEDYTPWVPPTEMPGSCLSCHPNNDPWILTPWLQPSYMTQILTDPSYPLQLPRGVQLEDVMAARFIQQTSPLYKTMLPEPLPEGRTAWTEEEIFGEDGVLLRRQYRAVGSSYVANETAGTVKNRSGIRDPAWDIPFRERLLLHAPEDSCAQGCHATATAHFEPMAWDSVGEKFAAPYLTDTMHEGAVGWTWMPPGGEAPEHFADPTIPAITECPIPKQLHEASATCEDGVVTVAWEYENDYGSVPGRDDIRFDVAWTTDLDTKFLGRALKGSPEGVQMESETVGILRDIAPSDSAQYVVRVPAELELRIELQPKRYCFEEPDRRPFAYAQPLTVEVSCD